MSTLPLPPGFEARGLLGRGGTAIVEKALWIKTGQEVALKRPLCDDKQSIDLFKPLAIREKTLVGSLRFPGISQLLDSDTTVPYLAYEVCKGKTLDALTFPLSSNVVSSLLSAIAINLEFLRLNGLVHADLKPQNMFLPVNFSENTAEKLYHIKLSDFSLGRLESEDDSVRAGLGTIGYMAPETIKDNITSHRSDLFTLGVIGYQLLTGRQPFLSENNDPVKSNSRTVEHTPSPPHEVDSSISKEISEIIMLLLQKDETDRPVSGWDVCQRIEATGCRYPFRKVLNPSFCIGKNESYDNALRIVKPLPAQQNRWLSIITEQSVDKLRLILTVNFRNGNVVYNGNQFEFKESPYWPSKLRRSVLKQLKQFSYSEKKQKIISAVSSIHLLDDALLSVDTHATPDPLSLLLPHLISHRTIKKIASNLTKMEDAKPSRAQKAILHLLAGKLDLAIEEGHSAIASFVTEHQYDNALTLLNKLIEYGKIANKEIVLRQIMIDRANLYREIGNTDNAMQDYLQVIEMYASHPDDHLLAEAYKNLGDIYKNRQDFDAGISVLKKALSIYTEGNNELEISHILNNMGNMYWIASNHGQALIHYRAALKLQRKLSADSEVASTLSNIGSIFTIQGRYARAINIMNLSLTLKKEIGNKVEIARSLNNLGYTHHLCGNQHKAVNCLKESFELNQRTGTRKEILYNLDNLTEVMTTAGQLAESLSYLKEGLTLSSELSDLPHTASFNLCMATVLRRMGRIRESLHCIDHVSTVIDQVDDRILPITLKTNRAQLAYTIGDFKTARTLAQEALFLSEELKTVPAQLNALLLLCSAESEKCYLEKAEKLISRLGLTRERTLARFNHLSALLDADDQKTAIEWGESILNEMEGMTEDIEHSRICNLVATIKLLQNDSNSAMTYLSKSLSESRKSQLVFEQIEALTMIGQIESSNGDYERAFGKLKDALAICKTIAAQLVSDEQRGHYLSQRSIRFLTQEIKRLSQFIGSKKGQA